MSAIPEFARFWMVCRKPVSAGTKTEPRRRYSHKADAIETARRLANDTGAVHLVLETVESVRPLSNQEGFDL